MRAARQENGMERWPSDRHRLVGGFPLSIYYHLRPGDSVGVTQDLGTIQKYVCVNHLNRRSSRSLFYQFWCAHATRKFVEHIDVGIP